VVCYTYVTSSIVATWGEGDAVKSLRLETLASGTSAEFEVPHGV